MGAKTILLPNKELLSKVNAGSNIPALDAVRGIAAAMVVIAHTIGPRQLGSMAVAIFFVLSGFLITWLLVKESDNTGQISLRDFYMRRTLRIFPAFYVFWVVCVGAAIVRGAQVPWGEAWSSFFYVGDYFAALKHNPGGIMGITWSLGVEEKFYLLWPFVFASLHRNPAKLFKLGCLFIVGIWLYRVVLSLAFSLPTDYLRYSFESRFDNILYGSVLALAFRMAKLDPILRAAERVPLMPIALTASLLGLTFLEEYAGATYHYLFGMALDSTVIAVTLIQLVYLATLHGWTWLNHPALRFLGRISYSLYLYHIVLIDTVHHYLPNLRIRWAYPLIYVGSVLTAYASYRLVERPFLKLKNHFAAGSHI
ncbi:MAG: acyltransferase [Candidatus Acidiferrum sp.]|jgi:peptidoglycan/LPS O-acetylase OafA/YrhL